LFGAYEADLDLDKVLKGESTQSKAK